MFGYKRDFGYIKKQNPLKKAVAIYPMTGGPLVQKQVTNLMTNGDFEDSHLEGYGGFYGTNTISNLKAYTGLKSCEYTVSITSNVARLQGNFTAIAGHTYYVFGAIYPLYANSTKIQFGGGDLSPLNPEPGKWTKLSGIVMAIIDYPFRVYHDTSSGYAVGDKVYFDSLGAIDLTAIYEASKTPTVGQCGYFFPNYFNGTKTFLLPENPATQELEDTSKPRVNLIPAGTENFSNGWVGFNGSSVTVIPNQPDPFGGNNAVRLQSTGGTSRYKCVKSGTMLFGKGVPYIGCLWVKGVSKCCIGNGLDTATAGVKWTKINSVYLGNGQAYIPFYIGSSDIAVDLDILVYGPGIFIGTDPIDYIPPSRTANFPLKKSGILGSAVGVYTSVPTFNGRGIKPDGADDLIKMPVTFDPNQDFTVFIAADVGTGMPTGYKTLWSLGNSAANVYISLTKLVTSGHLLFDLYNGTDNISIKINLENLRAGIRLYRLQRKNNKLYVKEMFGASSVESALITANTVVDLQTLFAKGTSSYTYYTDAEENFMAQFNYACSDSESLKIGNHIRKILLQRGVDIA